MMGPSAGTLLRPITSTFSKSGKLEIGTSNYYVETTWETKKINWAIPRRALLVFATAKYALSYKA